MTIMCSWTFHTSPPISDWPDWDRFYGDVDQQSDTSLYASSYSYGYGCRCPESSRDSGYIDPLWYTSEACHIPCHSGPPDDYHTYHPLAHLTEYRYLPGRLPTADPNPRGKNHRKPLSWKRKKAQEVQGWQDDADAYSRHVWREQQQGRGKGEQERPNKPHFLKFIEANRRRNRYIRYRCSCCYHLRAVQPRQGWGRTWPVMVKEGREIVRDDEWVPGGSAPAWYRGPKVVSRSDIDVGGGCEKEDGMVDDALVSPSEGDYKRGPEFNLGDIVATDPVYSVRYLPAKRKRVAQPRTTGTFFARIDGQKLRVNSGPDTEPDEWSSCNGQPEWDLVDWKHDGEWTCVSDVGSECGSEWIAVDSDDADCSNASAKDDW